MTKEQEEIAELKRRLDNLVQIVRLLDDEVRLSSKYLMENGKSISQLYRNGQFLYSKIFPVFQKVFPDDTKFQMEFERVLGKDIGPEEPKRRS